MAKKYRYIEKNVKLPNGRKTHLQMIDHPGAVLIIPFINRNTIILLKQYRPSIKKYIYELPAGTIDKGETPLRCAKRELIEETGFKAGKIKKLGEIYPVPGYSNEIIYIYRAEELSRQNGKMDEDEIIENNVCKRNEVKRMFDEGKIKDAKTISALTMCGWL